MVVREVRERECNTRDKAVGWINEDMAELGKDLERARDKAGTDGAALPSAGAKAHRIASNINGVR